MISEAATHTVSSAIAKDSLGEGAERQTALLRDALAAATAISTDYARARALAALAPHLPETLLPDALAAGTAISNDLSRAHALAALAPYLPEGPPTQIISAEMLAILEEVAADFSSIAARVTRNLESQFLAAREDNARLNALNALVTTKLDELSVAIPTW